MRFSPNQAVAVPLLGGVLIVLGAFESAPDWTLIGCGAALLAAGLVLWRNSRTGPGNATRLGLAVPGVVLAATGAGAVASPFVFLALHDYTSMAISFAPFLVGPYFLTLGYILLWQAFVGSAPPFGEKIGGSIQTVARILNRSV